MPSPSQAYGFVGPGTLNPDTPGTARARTAPAADALMSAAFTADALALVAYTRSTVETTSKDGVPGELNVASAGLKRPAEGFLMAPLESLQESSSFGLRTSPITGSSGEFHWGQDFAAPCGTRVYSADAGVVRAVGWHPWGGGNRVEIDHGNGLITTYNHLEGIAVKKGDSVRVGEVIARVGTTGSSTGCHLHFETILNGSHKNPHDWILLPIVQTDQLGALEMASYAPDAGKPSNTSLGWAIPVSEDGTHVVAGGAEEVPAAALPGVPYSSSPAPEPTPSIWDALSPTKTRSDTPTPEPSQPPGGTTTTAGTVTPSDTPPPSEPSTEPPPPSEPSTEPPLPSE
ncbi:MAG TPA: peptidoglycan DD-metalloendopeptidase family protein, partial [Arthrobacter sp.]|nr:peptidoglycan DD-metalloendopeptidase family protein [Arthrobacter sp.]